MRGTDRLRINILFAIFMISGFAGLVYQSVWSHYLGLFLGHAAYAQALVLSIFMGGMAAGAALVAFYGEHWKYLIRRYAVVEAVVGALGLAFHIIYVHMLNLSYETLMPWLGQPWLINSYKWVLGAVFIFPQSMLLGMTFPLMSGGIIRRHPGNDGVVLGNLYFTNSIGAAIGVLIAAFILLPSIGLPGAMVVAGITNFIVAALAWVIGASDNENQTIVKPVPSVETRKNNPFLFVVLSATFLSGAASFVYEVVWIRLLSLAVGNTLHTFELMLASFIAGIALGGLWVRRRADQTDNVLRMVGLVQMLMGMAALASLAVYVNAFSWVGFLLDSLSRNDGGYALFNIGTAAISIVIMMPAAFFAGATLPLFTLVLLRSGQGEASIGRVYAWNTLGAIAGVVVAIHLLIPILGLKYALVAAALVDMVVGLILLYFCNKQAGLKLKLLVPVFAIAMSCVIAAVIPFDVMRLGSGVYRSGLSQLSGRDEVIFYQDGKTASVSVVVRDGDDVRIATNGKVDASIRIGGDGQPTYDEPTMVLAAALPLAYNPGASHAAVVGFGSGLTTHTLLASATIEAVDTIEIEAAMVAGSRWFLPRNSRAYDDPRSNVVIDDAKSFFAGTRKRYDIIISEPSNPWVTGIGALFSKEFYQYIPAFLEEDGIFLQWLQLYEIDDDLVGSVINALIPAFADYSAFLSNDNDLLIIASPRILRDDIDFSILFQGEMLHELANAGFIHPEQLEFRKVLDASMLRTVARMFPTRANSDYHPLLSLDAPRTRFRRDSANAIRGMTTLNFPLLEWMGIREPMPKSTPVGVTDHFRPLVLTERARRVARILLNSDRVLQDEARSPALDRAIRTLAVLSACGGNGFRPSEDLIAEELLWLSGIMLPYLSADDLQGVLIDGKLEACRAISEDTDLLISLLSAHAGRAFADMEQLGLRWLAGSGQRSESLNVFDMFALLGLRVALVRQGRMQESQHIPTLFEHLWNNNIDPQFADANHWLDQWLLEYPADE